MAKPGPKKGYKQTAEHKRKRGIFRRGADHPSWKGDAINRNTICIDCGKEVHQGSMRCKPCAKRGSRAPRYRKPIVAFRRWVRKTSQSGCWNWVGHLHDGYGRFSVEGELMLAHRFIYEMSNGPIPSGHVVHHQCHNRACVNPAHLEAMSPEDHNALHRGEV